MRIRALTVSFRRISTWVRGVVATDGVSNVLRQSMRFPADQLHELLLPQYVRKIVLVSKAGTQTSPCWAKNALKFIVNKLEIIFCAY